MKKNINYLLFMVVALLMYVNVNAASDIVCVRASELNKANGVTYGNLGSGDTLKPGDAFDCDVKGTGTGNLYRFYYVTDTDNRAVLLSAKVLVKENKDTNGNVTGVEGYSYSEALSKLPTSTSWPTVSLTSTTRTNKNENGDTSGTFDLGNNVVARLLTYQELKSACTEASTTSKSLQNCTWLLENTKFEGSSSNSKLNGYWLENSSSTSASNALNYWIVYGGSSDESKTSELPRLGYIEGTDQSLGIKVAIEVEKSRISTSTDKSVLVKNKKVANVSVGDYIYMTPSSSSITTDKSKTGCDNTQTFNPKLLNRWRVLKKNDNGTIQVISEYVQGENANTGICLKGKTGYINSVGYLNTLAKSYENSNYTVSGQTRHVGYYDTSDTTYNTNFLTEWGFNITAATETITDTSKISEETPNMCENITDTYDGVTRCWTRNHDYETRGGGDYGSVYDQRLMNSALKSAVAYNVYSENKKASTYWLASRVYTQDLENKYYWFLRVRSVNESGEITNNYDLFAYDGGRKVESSRSSNLRPIVTLKADLYIKDGDGTESSPYGIGTSIDSDETSSTEAKKVARETNTGSGSTSTSSENGNGSSSSDASDESQKEVENPKTGAFISVITIGILGSAAYFINRYVKKKKVLVKL